MSYRRIYPFVMGLVVLPLALASASHRADLQWMHGLAGNGLCCSTDDCMMMSWYCHDGGAIHHAMGTPIGALTLGHLRKPLAMPLDRNVPSRQPYRRETIRGGIST